MSRNRLIAVIAGAAVLVLAIVGVVTFSVASANNHAAKDNGTSGVASGGKTPSPIPSPTSTEPSQSTDPAAPSGSGAGPADPNDPSLGITVVQTPDAGSPGDGSASVPDNPASDKVALDFVNAWISADYSNSGFQASKVAAISAVTPDGSRYRSTFSKLATACQGKANFSYKVGALSSSSAHATAIAANGNYVYSVIGTANARFGWGGQVADHVFEGSLWSVELPPPGQPQVVKAVTESIPGYNLDNC